LADAAAGSPLGAASDGYRITLNSGKAISGLQFSKETGTAIPIRISPGGQSTMR
jgi:hypothetical protein